MEAKSTRLTIALRIHFTLCTLANIVFTFSNSADIGEISGGKSALVTAFLNTCLHKVGIGWQLTEHLVRKLGHLAEYTLLGF